MKPGREKREAGAQAGVNTVQGFVLGGGGKPKSKKGTAGDQTQQRRGKVTERLSLGKGIPNRKSNTVAKRSNSATGHEDYSEDICVLQVHKHITWKPPQNMRRTLFSVTKDFFSTETHFSF